MSEVTEDIKNGLEGAAAGAAAGGSVAATGAAIAAAASLAIPPPFGEMAAPFAAALGAMIGIFCAWAKRDAAAEKLRLQRLEIASNAHAKMLAETAGTGPAILAAAKSFRSEFGYLAKGGEYVGKGVSLAGLRFQVDQWTKDSDAAITLRALADQYPQYAPMVNQMFAGAKAIVEDYKNGKRHLENMQKVADFIAAIGSMPGDLSTDPFVYLRPPLSNMFGPALNAAGINIADPQTLAILRGNYDAAAIDFSQAKWGTLQLTTDMNIYGGPTEAQRQQAAAIAKKFAGGGGGGPGLATPMYGSQGATSSGTSPIWYIVGAVVVLGGGYYYLTKK